MADEADDTSSADKNILYEVSILEEWNQEPELLTRTTSKEKHPLSLVDFTIGLGRRSAWTVTNMLGMAARSPNLQRLPKAFMDLKAAQMNWRMKISSDGTLLAILQDQSIEIRSSKDDFQKPVATWPVTKDPHQQWCQLAWNDDATLLAHADSYGTVCVYDGIGTLVCCVNKSEDRTGAMQDLSDSICALIFKETTNKIPRTSDLLIINHYGILYCYQISEDGCLPSLLHSFSFSRHLRGITSVEYDHTHSLLLVGGQSDPSEESEGEKGKASQHGITAWRMLSGSPHYKLVTDYDQDLKSGKNRWRIMRSLSRYTSNPLSWQKTELDGVFAMKLSPDGSQLVVIHQSGQLSLWQVPSLRLINIWQQNQQPGYNDVNEEIAANPKRRKEMKEYLTAFFLSDINWWSDEAVILARGTGAVTVSSVDDLVNLLGSSPEWFSPAPQLSMAVGGGFLGMECECKYRSLKRHLMEGDGHTDCEDSDDDMDATVVTRTTKYVRHALYFVTDMERFQPPRKKPRMVTRDYRLVCLKSTTPEELYARKIEHEEYGNALSLAKAYNLDCDLVYQRQWRKSPVSVASIQDYLSKISKRSWVLRECLERVPEDYDAMQELLRYGLRGTDLEALIAIGEGPDGGRFILCDHYDEDDLDPLDPYDPAQVEAAEEAKEEARAHRATLLAKIDFQSLTIEQRELCQARLKFLQYQDRFHTYEEMLGGMHCAGERYDWSFFEKFRSENIVQLAADYARMGDVRALDIIFSNHGPQLNQHRLAILSNFPETFSPDDYAELLPAISEGDRGQREVVKLLFEAWRRPDWAEDDLCKKNLHLPLEDAGDFLYEGNSQFKHFRGEVLNEEKVCAWYKFRALEIEALSCQVDNTLKLISNAQTRNIKGLEALQEDFVVMETLVYECLIGPELNFAQLLKMSDIERLTLMMSLSSNEMYTKNLHRWLLPFLQRVNEREASASHALLREYVVAMAKDNLALCLKVFEASKANLRFPIIRDEAQLISLALECIYACSRDDQVSNAFGILECLPQRDFGVTAHSLESLHNQIDLLECHLSATELLEKHQVPQTVAFIKETQQNSEKTKDLFIKLTRIAGRRSPAMNEERWMQLLTDMLSLQEKVYQCIEQSACYEIFVESLLCSGCHRNISLAGKMLTSKSSDDFFASKVTYERSVELILSAAREYFDSAASLTDASMDLARSCLSLIGDRPVSIVEELSLIESLAMLDGFGISMLPVQVRMCSDRLTLVQKAIDIRPKVTYKNSQRLLKLGFLLNISSGSSDTEKQGRVLKLVAQAAMKNKDFSVVLESCMFLMDTGYAPIWTECKALGECLDFNDIQSKSELLSFAVTHCSPEMIIPILNAKCALETQLLKQCFNRDGSSSERSSESPESSRTAIQQTKDFIASSNRALSTL